MRLLWCVVLVAGLSARAVGDKTVELTAEERARIAKQYFELGDAHFRARDYQGAIRDFSEGYRLSAKPLFLYNLGHAHRAVGELARAKALFGKFLNTAPERMLREEVVGLLVELDERLRIAGDQPPVPVEPPAPAPAVAPAAVPPVVAPAAAAAPTSAPSPVVAPGPAAAQIVAVSPSPEATRRRKLAIGVGVGVGAALAVALSVGLAVGLTSSGPSLGVHTPMWSMP